MECVQSEQAYKWLRSDGGWSTGRLYCAIGKVVTSWGLKALGSLDGVDCVLMKESCDGTVVFVEWSRLSPVAKREE
jgi:hypothetical protein